MASVVPAGATINGAHRAAAQCLHTCVSETHVCRHWAAATSGVQAMGFSRAGIGVYGSRHWCFWVQALVFLSVGNGVFVVVALGF
jgi:hypothetical protein